MDTPQNLESAAGIVAQALQWVPSGACMATVIRTWGSAPRRAGSLLAVNRSGEFCGSVSGGCVEVAVIEASLEAIEDGRARILEFGVDDESAWAVGLACGEPH